MVEEYPELGLFYRYTTTAVNDIMMDYKKTPLIGAIHKQTLGSRKLLLRMTLLILYNMVLTTMDDAIQQRDIILGRQALGTMITQFFACIQDEW